MKKIYFLFLVLSCFTIVAFNVKTSDNNLFSQSTQQNDAALLQIVSPMGGCDLGLEDVSVMIVNLGDTILSGSLTISYSANSASPVVETIGIPVFPGDTVVYTFSQLLNMAMTADTDFELIAWIDLFGDPIQTNDTITKTVISYLTPAVPSPVNQTVWAGNSASLTVSPIDTNLNYYWYDSIGGNLISEGSVFETPVLFDSASYFVVATSASFEDVYVGTGTTWLSSTSNNPYGQFYTSNNSQFLIKAEELIAAGYSAGSITSLALNVISPTNITSNGSNLDNFNIKLGNTTISEIDTNWITGLTEVFFAPQWPTVAGWNVHEFQYPFQWDGVSNLMVEFCFSNGTSNYSTNASLSATEVGFPVGHGIYTDVVYTCGDPGAFSKTATTKRPNMKFHILRPGCPANIVEVSANVEYALYDLAVIEVTSPVSGACMDFVDVTAHIYNNGLNPVSNFPISYIWNGTLQATSTVSTTINPGADIYFTFPQELNVETLWGQHTVCVYTSLINDGYTSNDEACTTFYNFDVSNTCACANLNYGNINDPPVNSSINYAYSMEWLTFNAPTDYTDVSVSLCGATWDTKLEVYDDCNGPYLFYNDDNYLACGSYGPSHINIPFLSAGTYYVKVFGYQSYYGSYSLSITGDPTGPSSQSIILPSTWSIFSTYLQPDSSNISYVLSEVEPNMIIAKDGLGQPYWPLYGVNLIGNLTPGWGYQIKMTNTDTLLVEGNIIQPDTLSIQLPAQWSMLGYVRVNPAPIVDMLSPIISSVAIVKNGYGQVYWPSYNIDLIGNMQPGEGYQIKMSSQQTLSYPAN